MTIIEVQMSGPKRPDRLTYVLTVAGMLYIQDEQKTLQQVTRFYLEAKQKEVLSFLNPGRRLVT